MLAVRGVLAPDALITQVGGRDLQAKFSSFLNQPLGLAMKRFNIDGTLATEFPFSRICSKPSGRLTMSSCIFCS